VTTADVSDAAGLFVNRARSVRPGFVLDASNVADVLNICRRLDGIPLAIELAAARMTTLSPHDIVPRLEDSLHLLTGGSRNAVSRQHTLRATIDWSYQLLDLTSSACCSASRSSPAALTRTPSRTSAHSRRWSPATCSTR